MVLYFYDNGIFWFIPPQTPILIFPIVESVECFCKITFLFVSIVQSLTPIFAYLPIIFPSLVHLVSVWSSEVKFWLMEGLKNWWNFFNGVLETTELKKTERRPPSKQFLKIVYFKFHNFYNLPSVIGESFYWKLWYKLVSDN